MSGSPGRTASPPAATHRAMAVALPLAAVALSLAAWGSAVSRSGFWADDFLDLTHFNGTVGDLGDSRINTGKYAVNFFWALGTKAFGTASAVPFLLMNMLVLSAGVAIWLRAGSSSQAWSGVDACWIAGLFVATAAWYPTALWSTNVTHSGGFLALGAGLAAHQRSMRADTAPRVAAWSLASGTAWTLGVVSNLVYVGLLVLAAWCAWHQLRRLQELGWTGVRAGVAVAAWNLVLPVAYFGLVAYPATKTNTAYADTGLGFVRASLHFYRAALAPGVALTVLYVLVVAGAAAAAGAALVRRRDWFPAVVLVTAAATALPALVQSQQRDVHYMAMPLLLTFSALGAGARPLLVGASVRLRGAALAVAAIALVLVFDQGSDVRSFFVASPFGSRLAAFRTDVAALTPGYATICAKLYLEPAEQSVFFAEMSGPNGFLVPPIDAVGVDFVQSTAACPAGAAAITVGVDRRGDFVAGAAR